MPDSDPFGVWNMQKLLTGLAVLLTTLTPAFADLDTTGAVKVTAHNSSVPKVDGKDLWIHYDGLIFLDAAVANPRLSYQLIGFLEKTRLRRIRQTASSGPGSSPGTEGNLNFGTSGECCNYARMNFSAPGNIPYPARTTPFLLTGSSQDQLVFGDVPNERSPWYACASAGSSWYTVYYNKPYYEYPDHGDSECTIVSLLAPHDQTPTPPA